MDTGKDAVPQGSKVAAGTPGAGSGVGSATTLCINSGGGDTSARPSWRHGGKQPVQGDRTEEERAPIIVNIAKARGIANIRLLAVGVLLSTISITSERLVSYMRNVWKICAHIESLELADNRFILEFSSTGDYEHVTEGGPWSSEASPSTSSPNSWRGTWERRSASSSALTITQEATSLKRSFAHGWITLEDELTDDEVVVSVFYERLPSYCTCCGVIGHQADACELPATLRRTRYAKNLSVPPTHRDDKRKWYLAESALENGRALQTDIPWRNVAALGPRRDHAPSRELGLVAHVVKEVQKLSVKDNNSSDMNGKSDTTNVTKPMPSPADVAITTKPGSDTKQHKANTTTTGASDVNKLVEAKKGSWKRKARNEAEGEAEEPADGDRSTLPPAVGVGGWC
ncbi:hypothetical protein ACQ4PT_061974 [Festuca glaucescens]